ARRALRRIIAPPGRRRGAPTARTAGAGVVPAKLGRCRAYPASSAAAAARGSGDAVNPLSAIFGSALALRHTPYDRGIFKCHRLARPVISVGNLSVGGSGKTPFVIALGELLKARGIAFDVLSRGYGRRAEGISIVDPTGSPDRYGDEPLLIAGKLQ